MTNTEEITAEKLQAMTQVEIEAWISAEVAKIEKAKGLCTEKVVRCANGQPEKNLNPPYINGCGPHMQNYPTLEAIITGMSNGLTPFKPCCNNHDSCYSAWGKYFTYSSRKDCDSEFYQCMLKNSGSGFTGIINKGVATAFYGLVRNVGCGPYANGRISSNCVGGKGTAVDA